MNRHLDLASTALLFTENTSSSTMAPEGFKGEGNDEVLATGAKLGQDPPAHVPVDRPADLLYGIEDNPPSYLSVLYGFQVGRKALILLNKQKIICPLCLTK